MSEMIEIKVGGLRRLIRRGAVLSVQEQGGGKFDLTYYDHSNGDLGVPLKPVTVPITAASWKDATAAFVENPEALQAAQ